MILLNYMNGFSEAVAFLHCRRHSTHGKRASAMQGSLDAWCSYGPLRLKHGTTWARWLAPRPEQHVEP